ncbi:MAG TPA: response regulator transcription factor [Terriglobales bacterium]|nr:response regulator transcription factor [Terriglobales bacterium]
MPPLRIFVADHDAIIRNVMTAVLVRDGWQICGEASTGQEAIAKISSLKPDLVLMDIELANPTGLDTTRQIVEQDPVQPIVILGTTDDEPTARKAFEAGALGYVLKANAARDLVTAIRSLTEGKTFFTPRIAENILHSYFQIGPNQKTASSIRSERDRIAIKLLAREAATAMGTAKLRQPVGMSRSMKALISVLVAGTACVIIWMNYQNTIEENVPFLRTFLVRNGLQSVRPEIYEGNPDIKVWVDLHTAIYYCPSASLYGKTPKGKYARQGDALEDHFEPAGRQACK